jgi:hypothetical protein
VVGSYLVRADDSRTGNGSQRRTRGSLRSYLALAAIPAIVLLALASEGRRFHAMLAARFYAGEAYVVSGYERRYDAVRPFLPKLGVVGYLSDRMEPNEQFLLTQYTLVPLRVDLSPDHPIVVGNFFDPRAGPALARRHGLAVVRDFGNGLLLLRQETE